MTSIKNKFRIFFSVMILQSAFLTISCQKTDPLPANSILDNGDSGEADNDGKNTGGKEDNNGEENENIEEWSISKDFIFDGGPGKDGIPSIDEPSFSLAKDIDFLLPSDLIIAVKIKGEIKAYPHAVLDWHEIVNDEISDIPFSLNYCPLTGTGMAWKRTINDVVTTFGVSGLLYNSNLIPYDRQTDTNWSQMLFKGIGGELNNQKAELIQVIETSWSNWLKLYPDSKVLNAQTGSSRDYSIYPYGNYKTTDQILFPITIEDKRLFKKARGLGIFVENKSKFYPIQQFYGGKKVVNEDLRGHKVVVFGDSRNSILVTYNRTLEDGTVLDFSVEENVNTKIIMRDNEGNLWDLFGEAVEGPRKGTILTSANNYMGYWFAVATFYANVDIYK